MALPSSGNIALSQVNVELLNSATTLISLGQASVRALAGVASGPISLGANLWGKSYVFNVAYLAGGSNSTNAQGVQIATTTNEKYNFDTAAISAATAVSGWNGARANGNRQVAILSAATTATSKYTYSSDSVSAGGTLSAAAQGAFTLGTSTYGYQCGDGNSGATRKYTYSSDTCVTINASAMNFSGTNHSRTSGASVGNNTKGAMIDGTGNDITTYRILTLTYATDSGTVGLVVGYGGNSRSGPQGASGPTFGLSVGGNDNGTGNPYNTSYKYTYSTDATAAGASYTTTTRGGNSGCGNSIKAIFSGGLTIFIGGGGPVYTYYNIRDIYTFSSETFGTTTALGTAKSGAWAYSANPGYIQ